MLLKLSSNTDGNTFDKLDQGSGNFAYVFYDGNPINGNNFYLLKMVDFSDEENYSNVVLVKRNDISGGISVYPIPADNMLHINYSNRALDGSKVIAMDLQGRVMAKATLTTSTQMNIQKWPAGIYMLRFVDGSVVKVVKK